MTKAREFLVSAHEDSYIFIDHGPGVRRIFKSKEVYHGLYLDLAADGRVLGIEIQASTDD